jgi:hypothetical protein
MPRLFSAIGCRPIQVDLKLHGHVARIGLLLRIDAGLDLQKRSAMPTPQCIADMQRR